MSEESFGGGDDAEDLESDQPDENDEDEIEEEKKEEPKPAEVRNCPARVKNAPKKEKAPVEDQVIKEKKPAVPRAPWR